MENKARQHTIELLAPARDAEVARAAIACGADAVYMGGPRFGARQAAGNPVEDIARVVAAARPFGVRVYVTLNTLVFDDELAEAERIAREVIDAGVDALALFQKLCAPRACARARPQHANAQKKKNQAKPGKHGQRQHAGKNGQAHAQSREDAAQNGEDDAGPFQCQFHQTVPPFCKYAALSSGRFIKMASSFGFV